MEGFPTDAVAATPVGICVLDLVSLTLPTEAVVERPVRVYEVSKVKEPRDDVIDCPVKVSAASSTLPQPFSPQAKVPQPG